MTDATGIRVKCKISAPDDLYYHSSFEKLLHFGWKVMDKDSLYGSQMNYEDIKKREQDEKAVLEAEAAAREKAAEEKKAAEAAARAAADRVLT